MPTEVQIRNALLQELYTQKTFSLSAQNAAYAISDGYFDISQDELNERYGNSRSKWVNRVQVVRNHLVDQGIILPTNISGRNIWKLSDQGIIEAKRIYLLYNEDDPHEDILSRQINQDLVDLSEEEGSIEGAFKFRLSNYYERDPSIRAKAVKIHGLICKACNFDFEETYGELGKNFIEVHHLVPLSTYKEAKIVNPEKDMTVLCSNCHRMIHRKHNGNILSLEELKDLIVKNG